MSTMDQVVECGPDPKNGSIYPLLSIWGERTPSAVAIAAPGRALLTYDRLRAYATAHLGIAVAPDDWDYVAFTAGCMGAPKGISGRIGRYPMLRDILTPVKTSGLSSRVCRAAQGTIATWPCRSPVIFSASQHAIRDIVGRLRGGPRRLPGTT